MSAPVTHVDLNSPLQLPCGARLKNRLVKAAMTEGLADTMNRATEQHRALYARWAGNGLGLMLTGNIQVDRRQLERPGNIAIDGNGGLAELRALATTGTRDGAHFWVQLNHPGRQTPASINPKPLAPSAISLPMAEAGCGEAQAMTESQIEDVIRRFVHAATVSREAGFTGVQLHGAHGYLISQFLSPLANQRTDAWGGSLENRARLLLETVRQTRRAVGADFPISVKLNSADFQRGGFSEDESATVVSWLAAESVDMLEISGGTYEQMRMVGLGDGAPAASPRKAASTLAREAYFLDYARRVRPLFPGPLMITGGMRTVSAMNEALQAGDCELIGIARPMCAFPDSAAGALLNGSADALPTIEDSLSMARDALGAGVDDATFKRIESFALLGWYCNQVLRIGQAQEPALDMSVYDALLTYKAGETAAAAAWSAPA
jgi:2,4-dienoyl-CoA reductase-like NADH-dependent reductase (Old Yellow Enzyme family)